MKTAMIFPGQGSQYVGMGKELYDAFAAAREVYDEVDDALSQRLSQLMFSGPEEGLTLTENAQPAIMAVSLAAARVLEKEAGLTIAATASYVAGHSLGEYSALAAAGSFTLADTARLLKLRGQAMQRAVPAGVGAMAALLGLDAGVAVEIAAEAAQGDVCALANDNAPGQAVISGHAAAVERAIVLAKARGAKRAVMLSVSAPFHCELMLPAAEVMRSALDNTPMRVPLVPLIANVSAAPEFEMSRLRALLVAQVAGRVRWRESMEFLKSQGVARVIELGAGKVLTGLSKRIAPEMDAWNISQPQDLEAFTKECA